MAVVINEFEAVAAPVEGAPAAAPATVRPRLAESQRALRQLAARAARLRAH
jgi:hypothetical protein